MRRILGNGLAVSIILLALGSGWILAQTRDGDTGSPAEPPSSSNGDAPTVQLPPALPIDLALLRPDTLAGWTHAAQPPTGWSIEGGRLTGQAGATPLVSGYTMGDFELTFRWSAGKSAVVNVELQQVPDGPTLRVAFGETAACGKISSGGQEVSAGSEVGHAEGPHTAKIERKGQALSVTVDDRKLSQAKIAEDCRFGLGLSVEGGDVWLEELRLQEPPGPPIFNGTDLTGWWCPGRIEAWQAIDGNLVLAGRGGNYLRTEKLYGNYTLSLEFKIKKGGNSGVGIRTARNGWPSGDGMELQLLDRPNVDKGGMMSIYRNVPPLDVAHQSEQWNQLVLKTEGRMISAWINGQLVQQVNTAWEPELKHRHLKGWIGFQDHGAKIEVRHLQLSEAPDGLGPSAWYEPRAESAIDFVFRRLLNPERLARDDGSWGTVTTATINSRGIHELAQWQGPGALVRLTYDNPEGKLSFYFDGEQQPRLTCRTGDLAGQVLRLPGARGSQPVRTCLPFEKSLRVEVVECAPATYRFECVRLPGTVTATTFSKDLTKIPAPLAAALDYRFHHHAHGVVRQQAPYLRIAPDRKRLAPDEHADFIQTDGAGLVQWVQLHAPKKSLQTDDLWIEITVDGETEPAVSAPVRYYFAGAVAGKNYGNYLFTDRGGPINRLAIPFGQGVQISLSNRGTEPIDSLGLTASIQQPTNDREAKDFAGRLRLRGTFRSGAGEPGNAVLFEQQGRGRLAAIVWDTAAASTAGTDGDEGSNESDAGDTAVDSEANGGAATPNETVPGDEEEAPANTADPQLPVMEVFEIDGKPAEGWQPASVNDLLGDPGQSKELRGLLSGRQGSFSWRYLLLSPIDFEKGVVAKVSGNTGPGKRLVLFYVF